MTDREQREATGGGSGVRRLSRDAAEMLLAGFGRRRSSGGGGSMSSSSHGQQQGEPPRRKSSWSMFGGGGGGGGRRGSRGALGGSGAGASSSRGSGSKFEASFGTLEFFANLGGFDDDDAQVPQPNLAPAARRASAYDGNDDDKEGGGSDEEAQRAGHQGGRQQRQQRSPSGSASEGDAARREKETGPNSEARRKSDGDADLEEDTSKTKLPAVAARPKHRSASMGFLPTRSTGVLSHDMGSSGEAPPPDFSRAASSTSSTAPRRGTSYRVSPLQQAASGSNSAEEGSSFHSSAGPKLMSDPNSAAAAAASASDASAASAERPKLTSESESAWSVVEAELEAVGSCHGSGGDLDFHSGGSHLQAEIKRWAADRHHHHPHDVYDDWGGKAQRRKSRLGLIVAAISVMASAGAAIVLVQSGNGAFGDGGGGGTGTAATNAASAAVDSVSSTLPTESAEDGDGGGGGEPNAGHRGPRPPPITTDLFESCSPSNVYSSSDAVGGGVGLGSTYEACKSLCEGAECCYLPPDHALSCVDYETEDGEQPCPVYIRTCGVLDAVVEAAATEKDEEEMAVFEKDQGGESVLQQAVKASPLPPDRDVLKARCSLTAVRSASGYSRCWDLCEEGLCCVEDQDDTDVAVFLEARSAAAVSSPASAPEVGEGTDGGGVGDEGPCRDDCDLFEPCRSLFSSPSGAATVEGGTNAAEDVYVVEEEEGEGGDI